MISECRRALVSGDKNIVSLKAAYCAAFLIYDIRFLSRQDDKNLISFPIDDKNIVSFPTVDQQMSIGTYYLK